MLFSGLSEYREDVKLLKLKGNVKKDEASLLPGRKRGKSFILKNKYVNSWRLASQS